MFMQIILILIGFVLLIKGADVLVEGASNLAKRLRVPEIIIGLTIVSIGTSMPELFVSVTSSLEGFSDISIGNVIGSNICNLLLILGLSSVIKPVLFKKETKLIEIPLSILITLIFMCMCNTSTAISRKEGIVLVLLFALFIIYTIVMAKKADKFDGTSDALIEIDVEKNRKEMNILRSIFFIVLGIVCLKFGADFVVDNSKLVAKALNISDKIIGLTIIAIGTSLPELVTSVVAAKKGNSDIAIGNIIGSNIFNILLIIGISAILSPINYNVEYNIELVILLFSMMLLAIFPFIKPKNEMSRKNGIIYLILYVMYTLLLLFK